MKKLTKILTLLGLMLAFAAPGGSAQNSFYVQQTAPEPGQPATLEFVLDNATPFFGFQAVVTIPAGLTLQTDAQGKPAISLNPERADDSYVVVANQKSGKYYLGCYSTAASQQAFVGSSGVLMRMEVDAALDFKSSDVKIEQIKFVGAGDRDVALTSTSTTLGVSPISIALSSSQLTIVKDETSTLTQFYNPEYTTERDIVWTSSDESVATVTDEGVVTAVYKGSAVITATTVNGKTATCDVTGVILTEAVELDRYEIEMYVGGMDALTATVVPWDASVTTVNWACSDETVLKVDNSGNILAVALGEATVTATCEGKTAECLVKVIPTPVESISLSNSELYIRIGYTTALIAIVRPADATDKSVTWQSEDESIVTVTPDGIITGIAEGTADVIVTSFSNPEVTAICKVYVEDPDKVISVTGIEIDPTEEIIEVGQQLPLSVTITPADATHKEVTFESSNTAVATVDADGVVTGVAPGTVTIYASSSNGLMVECIVTVVPDYIEVTSISLSNTELLLVEGDISELLAIIHPENATEKDITWTSEDPTIATVDANGVITAIKPGFTIVTVTAENGVKAECAVTVIPRIIAVEEITLNRTAIELLEGETFGLIATIKPDDATDKTVTWMSSNAAIATVDENGLVTGVSAGEATVYASSSNGLTAECAVTVTPLDVPVEHISLTNTDLLMRVGFTSELTAIVRPDNATNKEVTWEATDPSIASVDDKGLVTANAVGVTTVIATSVSDPDVSAICTVTVEDPQDIIAVTDLTIKPTDIGIEVGETFTLVATVLPADATDKTVTWKSSDLAIATVDADGVVTGVAEGVATIYASSSNGLTVECIVTVFPGFIPVESVGLTNTELLMRVGRTTDLLAIIAPDNATDKTLTWTSMDRLIATVDASGIVTAVSVGSTTITATAHNGVFGYCHVTVVPDVTPVAEISLTPKTLELVVEDTYNLTAIVKPDDATDKTITWKSSDWAVASVTTDGMVIALGVGQATIYASSSNGLTDECLLTVIPRTIEVSNIIVDPLEVHIYVGQEVEFKAIIEPEDATDKTVTWFSNNPAIADVVDGKVTGTGAGSAIITAINAAGKNGMGTVIVHDRPLTPKQLLRKGDGTTCTFVIMMPITDAELTSQGYSYVVGYTSPEGKSTILAETNLRYCHVAADVYNNDANDFWAFSVREIEPGHIATSNLRHLDGREEVCFDASEYGYKPGRGGFEDDEWITVTPSKISIKVSTAEDTRVAVYNAAGVMVFSKTYSATEAGREEIELNQFVAGSYIVTRDCDSELKAKKIIVR